MYSLAWLVVVGVIGAVLGGWLGHLVARVRSKAADRIQELEAELESARGEISGYRREVFDQFAETARKFRSLDESYNDLHRQLAESASVLCGEAAGPLLEAPSASAIATAPAATAAPTPQPASAAAPETSAAQADKLATADLLMEKVLENLAEDLSEDLSEDLPEDLPEDRSEKVAEAVADEREVPILVAEVSQSAAANGESAPADEKSADAALAGNKPVPRRADDAA